MSSPEPQDQPRQTPLVTADQLAARLRDPHQDSPTLLDVRWSLGTPRDESHQQYRDAHIPAAVFVDLSTALAGPGRADGVGGRHPMPTKDHFEQQMRQLGVNDGHPVVVYDAGPGLAAARAWWLLRYFGVEAAHVLDGGLSAWLAAGEPTESGEREPQPGDFTARTAGRPLISSSEITQWLDDAVSNIASAAESDKEPDTEPHAGLTRRPTVLIDARASERFDGAHESIDPVAGHIPGAANLPAAELIAEGAGLLPAEELAAAFATRGADGTAPPMLSCGSGVQACHLALAWEVAHPQAEPAGVYIGSWSDWISSADRPVARGGDRDCSFGS